MSNISLRGYIQKIEIMIDRGETDQAIFHCKTILKTYPKHIDSYRLLGKALLEKKKFGDAADIFQRVLSSVSDDFISQIGMSIIKEDENNLDAAIWYMERAFETQPSNKAVQEELRRLYSIRDGVAPPKIRLTRGALVRMYVKGELYTQATAEILAALSEDPNRIDLEVILARLYYLMGQKVDATEVCSKLISKLPYCYEANFILAEILPDTTRADDAKIFRQRIIELDPYLNFVENSSSSPTDIPDDSVMLDFADWDPTKIENTQPNWAESIGLNLSNNENSEDEEIEDWFTFEKTSDEEQLITSEIVTEAPIVSSDETIISENTRTDLSELLNVDETEDSIIPDLSDDEKNSKIPDWIKEAGWDAGDPENIDVQKGFNLIDEGKLEIEEVHDLEKEVDDDSENIEPGIIPEWLQNIAPVDQPSELENEDKGNENDEAFEKLFSQISNSDDNSSTNENKDDSMNWLKEYEKEFPDSFDSELPQSLSDENRLSDLTSNDNQKNINEDGKNNSTIEVESSDVLGNFDDQEISFESEKIIIDEKESRDTVNDLNQIELDNSLNEMDNSKKEPENDMAWLEALSKNQDIDDSLDPDQESDKNDFPDWIKDIDKESNNEEVLDSFIPSSIPAEKETTSEAMELPDWLNNNAQDQVDETILEIPEDVKINDPGDKVEESPIEIDLSSSETSQWLNEKEQLVSTSDEENNTIEDKLILKKDDKDPFVPLNVQEEILSEEQSELETSLSWMESLTEKQVSQEDSLVNKPVDKDDNPTEWVKSIGELEEIVKNGNGINDSDQRTNSDNQLSLTPDWLQALQLETDESEITNNVEEEITKLNLKELISDDLGKIHSELDIPEVSETEIEYVTQSQNEFDDLNDEIDDLLMSSDESLNLKTSPNLDKDVEILELDNHIESANFSEVADPPIDLDDKSLKKVEESVIVNENNISVPKTEISEFSQDRLNFAKHSIQKGNIDEALEVYNEFIHAELVLDQVINDLQDALNTQYPIEVTLWQALGDAQLRNNQLQEALDSYSKAEELL